jgi:anti-sigma B factor antagonist
MEVNTREAGNVVVVEPVDRRLDAHAAPSFKTRLISLIDGGHRQMLLDLHHVAFIDSSGLGVIVSALKRLGREGELKVCAPQPAVRSMFELTRLHRVIGIFDTEAEGLKSFAA